MDMENIEKAKLNYSERLKEAMAEIKAILKKYDIGGYVILHEPGYTEYFHGITPTWSMLKKVNNQIRISSKLKEDFNGDKEAQLKANTETASLIMSLRDGLLNSYNLFDELKDIIMDHWDITHTKGIHTPHQEN